MEFKGRMVPEHKRHSLFTGNFEIDFQIGIGQ